MLRYLSAIMSLGLLVTALTANPAPAQEDGDPVSIGTYRVIESEVLGETRRLLVHLPRGYDGSAIRYPVLYHTYGDYVEEYYTEAVRAVERVAEDARAPQMLLVGIDNIDRYRDLRPLNNDYTPAGIENYIRFLTEEVFPFVESNYRTSPYRIAAGPQAGAVFCQYALQFYTDLFDAFILNNPMVHKPSTELFYETVGSFFGAWKSSMKKYYFVTYGGADETTAQIEFLERFYRQTAPARAKGFDMRVNKLEGNTDFIPPLELEEGLEGLFTEYRVPLDSTFAGLDEIRSYYDRVSQWYGFEVAPSEIVLSFSADALLAKDHVDEAVEILEHATTLYPNTLNAWWRLANIAAGGGDTDRAIELYRKCAEIDPSVENFVERRIESLKRDG